MLPAIAAAIAVAVGVKVVVDALSSDDTPKPLPPYVPPSAAKPSINTRGWLTAPLVLVVGRTGAGKSSLINRLCGAEVAEVGDVASTTRDVAGYQCPRPKGPFAIVDTPGVGEVSTHDQYRIALLEWSSARADSIGCYVLVLQADARGYAEEVALVRKMMIQRQLPLIVALNQCDKVAPVRGPELATTWSEERDRGTPRSESIVQKVALVHRQLADAGLKVDEVVPVTSEASPGFNIDYLKRAIEERLW